MVQMLTMVFSLSSPYRKPGFLTHIVRQVTGVVALLPVKVAVVALPLQQLRQLARLQQLHREVQR